MKITTATTEQIRERMGATATTAQAERLLTSLNALAKVGIDDTEAIADDDWLNSGLHIRPASEADSPDHRARLREHDLPGTHQRRRIGRTFHGPGRLDEQHLGRCF